MKTNEELLAEANNVEFKFTAHGHISRTHNNHERGLFFIKRAIEVHGIDKYKYGLVQYETARVKVQIVCEEHGPFFQHTNDHLRGKGCLKCTKNVPLNTEEWIEKAKKVHGNRYSYNSTLYKNAREKVDIICHAHGLFAQLPNTHLSGKGCPSCGGNHVPSTDEWVAKAKLIHGDKYDYSKVLYKSAHENVVIICHEHGPFFQEPQNHLNFKGCPKCSGHNHDILYLLKCMSTGWYKIGITTNNVKRRISSIGGNLEEIYHIKLEDPRHHEGLLHQKYKEVRKTNLYVNNGNTEFFLLTEEQVQEVINYMKEL